MAESGFEPKQPGSKAASSLLASWSSIQRGLGKNRLIDTGKNLWLAKGRAEGEDNLGVWDSHIHTIICEISKQQDSTV